MRRAELNRAGMDFLPLHPPVDRRGNHRRRRRGAALGLDHLRPEGEGVRGGAVAGTAAAGRCARCNSGTAALEIGLQLAGIGPGDEVITTPLSWVATQQRDPPARARARCSSTSIRRRATSTSDRVEAAITRRTRARSFRSTSPGCRWICDRLYAIADKHGLRVIEDAAQAFGVELARARRSAARGDLIAFSFHANKNITTAEGGALVLPDESDVPLCEKLRLQGVVRSGEDGMDVDVAGGKSNLTDVAARIGLGQLAAPGRIHRQAARARAPLFRALRPRASGCELPLADFAELATGTCSRWCCPLAREARATSSPGCTSAGIGIGVHYPAIHLFSLYRSLGWREGQFPHAERIGRAHRDAAAVSGDGAMPTSIACATACRRIIREISH